MDENNRQQERKSTQKWVAITIAVLNRFAIVGGR